MIDLEELKHLWKDNIDSSVHRQQVNSEEIKTLLKAKSANIIDRLLQNLRIEIGVFMICLLLIACVPFYFHAREVSIVCLLVIGLIFIPYLFYYIKKYRELKKFYSYSASMKSHLEMMIAQLEKYLKIYFWGSIFLTPVTGFLSAFAILYQMKALGFLLYFDTFNYGILSYMLLFSLLLTLLSYPVMKWYIRKLYGQHLEKLKDCLKELNEIA